MQHRATTDFWRQYYPLAGSPRPRRQTVCIAQSKFAASFVTVQALQFKRVGERHGHEMWSARITLNHRALAITGRMDIYGSGLAITRPMKR
jgi:hypothetical protein